MGTFHVDCDVENVLNRKKAVQIGKMLVDTGSDHTWIPGDMLERIGVKCEKKDVSFVMANGQQITRNVGFAIIRSGEFFTIDEVVFAESDDLVLLGARTLEGFNASVDPKKKRLVAAGSMPAASTAQSVS